MNYEAAVTTRQALDEIKAGINIPENVALMEQVLNPDIEREYSRYEKRLRGVDTFYLDYHPLKEITKAINAMMNAKKYFAVAADEERRCENERQDLLHVLELVEDQPEEAFNKHAHDIAQISRDRRAVKNFQELIKPFYAVLIKNPKMVEEMRKAHSEMVKLDNVIKARQYTPKQRRDFDPLFGKTILLREDETE